MLDNGKKVLYTCKFCKSAIFFLLEENVPAMPKALILLMDLDFWEDCFWLSLSCIEWIGLTHLWFLCGTSY